MLSGHNSKSPFQRIIGTARENSFLSPYNTDPALCFAAARAVFAGRGHGCWVVVPGPSTTAGREEPLAVAGRRGRGDRIGSRPRRGGRAIELRSQPGRTGWGWLAPGPGSPGLARPGPVTTVTYTGLPRRLRLGRNSPVTVFKFGPVTEPLSGRLKSPLARDRRKNYD